MSTYQSEGHLLLWTRRDPQIGQAPSTLPSAPIIFFAQSTGNSSDGFDDNARGRENTVFRVLAVQEDGTCERKIKPAVTYSGVGNVGHPVRCDMAPVSLAAIRAQGFRKTLPTGGLRE
jgi:hypothetical protein